MIIILIIILPGAGLEQYGILHVCLKIILFLLESFRPENMKKDECDFVCNVIVHSHSCV